MKKKLRRILALVLLAATAGAFSLLGGASAAKDETVTLTCQANDGYVIGSVQAYDKTTGEQVKFNTMNSKAQVSNDRKSATVTFTMPAEDLKLVVQFMTTAEAAASGLTTDSGTSATKANTGI